MGAASPDGTTVGKDGIYPGDTVSCSRREVKPRGSHPQIPTLAVTRSGADPDDPHLGLLCAAISC